MSKDDNKPAAVPAKAPKSETLYAVDNIKIGGVRAKFGDLVDVPTEQVADMLSRGLVSRSMPLAPGEIPMPKGDVATIQLTGGFKLNRKWYAPGDRLEVDVPTYVRLANDHIARLVA